MNTRTYTVTGGLGFIGKHFVRHCLRQGHDVINIDKMNYAADREAAREFGEHTRYRFVHSDVMDLAMLPECDVIVNFAAESHVDESISDNLKFCQSNILGVQRLIELTRKRSSYERPLFIQISTDEVYGDIVEGSHSPQDSLRPSNPYAATKSAADLLLIGWGRTYDLRYRIIRLTNNYGLHQYPEKLIPKTSYRLGRGKRALVQGDGTYVRNWLHVEDSVTGIDTVIRHGKDKLVYHLCGDTELQNIEVVKRIGRILDVPDNDLYEFVPNRVGQDLRYNLDDSGTRSLGWHPERDFDTELQLIVPTIDPKRFL